MNTLLAKLQRKPILLMTAIAILSLLIVGGSVLAIMEVAARPDDIGGLARLFQHMAQTVYARTENLKTEVKKLRIQIDQLKREEQVSEIVETDFFQDLQGKAREMRRRRPGALATTAEPAADEET